MKKFIFAVIAAAVFCAISYAEVTNEIRYSGRLKAYQAPVNGQTTLRFTLYGDENGINSLWTSGDMQVSVTSGIFTCILRPENVDWRKKDVWLELRVNGNTLLPREKVMAQMYAIHSYSAEKLSSNGEIEVKAGNTVFYIGAKNNKAYVRDEGSSEVKYIEGVPAGTVIAFAGPVSKAPQGYLLCNGDSKSKNDYPDLYNAIGAIYGGDGNPNFKLPDFQGMFLRGAGARTITNYPNKAGVVNTTYQAAQLGAFQGDTIRNISGTFTYGEGVEFLDGSGVFYSDDYGSGTAAGGTSYQNARVKLDASRVVPISVENRPANYSVNYYIKY
ncbi:MAG: phage tail protein [Endomicrobium sp.]|jgi:hypothetical protein|nr:phage tail protein [Endomicrobium sp.]